MNRYLIYIEDELVDLYPNTSIQISISNFKIGNLTQRNVSYTNTIQIPYTENNVRLLSPLTVWSVSSKPYENHTIKIVESGHQIFIGRGYPKIRGKSITLEMYESGLDVFEILKTKLVSEARDEMPGLAGDFDAATFYAQRNSVSTVCAPVVNWGKLNNMPPVRIINNDFVSTLTPWENTNNNEDWEYDTNAAQASLTAANFSSVLFTKTVTLYQGYKYRLVVNVNLGSSVSTNFYLVTDSMLDLMDNISTSGNHTITYDIDREILNRNIEGIGLKVTVASSNVVRILDVTLTVDYDSFIEIDAPFYLPMYSYLHALNISVAQFNQINSLTLNRLTTAQSEYLDSLLLAYTRDEVKYSDSFIEEYNMIAEADGSQTISSDGDNIQFHNITKPKDFDTWISSNEIVSLGITGNWSVYLNVTISLVVDITTLTTGTLTFVLEDGGTGGITYESETFTTTGVKTFNIETKYTLEDAVQDGIQVSAISRQLRVYADKAGMSAFSVDILKATFTTNLIETPRETFQTAVLQTFENVLYSGILLPDISVYDFLRDFLIRTGGLVRYDSVNKKLVIDFLNNILTRKSEARDWTSKRVNDEEDSTEFSIDGYSKENYFQDKDYIINQDSRASISIINDHIEQEQVYYESQHDTISNESVKSVEMANLKVFGTESERLYNPSTYWPIGGMPEEFKSGEILTLIKTRDNVSTDPVVKYGSTTAASFKIGSYATWADLKSLFYENIEDALYKAKVVNNKYNLTSLDIETLDLFRLIYDNGAYYLILQINYTPGKISSVKMMKIDTREGVVGISVSTASGALIITGFSPTISITLAPIPIPTGEIIITGFSPTVTVGLP